MAGEINPLSREFAVALDAQDGLAEYRDAFFNADPEVIYLLGNSLGRLPLTTIPRLRKAVEQEWGADLIAFGG